MRVWQAGSHLTQARGAQVEDWSWAQTKRRLTTLYRLAKPYKFRTALSLGTLLAGTIVSLAPPYLLKLAIDDGISKHDLTKLGWIVVAFLGAGVLGLVFVRADVLHRLDRRADAGRPPQPSVPAPPAALARLLRAQPRRRADQPDHERRRGARPARHRRRHLARAEHLTLVGSAIVLFLLDWRLALATLTVLPFMTIATAMFRKRSGRAYRGVRETLGAVTATLAEDIAGMRVVQAFTRESANQQHFREVSEAYRASNQQTVVLNGLYFPFVDFLSAIATAIVLGYGGYLVFDHSMTIGTLTAFLGYLTNFFDPVQQLSQLYNTFLSAVAALDKIMDVLDEDPEVNDEPGSRELDRIEGHVRFDHVRFGYGEGPEVLHDLDLDVPAGTTVALVGHTGAGKSTIAKLLARFYDPREGRITIDGVDLREVTQESLRRQLGIVPQEGFLFAGTVRENIAFGRPDATPEEIVTAAQAVGAHEFILRLEDGYETELQERGSRLSLGQRQLVAFARALLADPRILILDEATSSVDIGTERKIERALRRLLADRTAFVIAHRLSTIRDADLIVVLENGHIIEQGSHEELLERNGLYTSLYGDWAADVA